MERWFAQATDEELVGLFQESRRCSPDRALVEDAIYRVSDNCSADLFAEPHSALHEVISVMQKLGLDPAHPPACYREAQSWMAADGLDDPRLQNLESLAFVTIDNPDSRDLDQAIYLERGAKGIRVLYALADAAYYIRPGSALFDEALKRGVTYYAPGFAAPMLPPELSEGLVSLNPDVLRRALVFDMQLDREGETCRASVYQARIRSRSKLSYQGVQAWLDARAADQPHEWDGLNFAQSLALLPELGQQRMALARERNVVEHNRREAQMSINPDDDSAFVLRMRDRNDVERYNEQVSLLCNMVGAQMLLRLEHNEDMHAVFRVHMPPLEDRLSELRKALDTLCELHQLPALWRWDGKQPIADYLDALPEQPAHLRQVFERQIMLINHASEFSAEPGPHHALGVDGYARFSSPMREIAGIFTHKELLEAQGVLTPQPRANDEQLRQQVISVANQAKRTQRKLEKSFQLKIVEQFLNHDLELPELQRPVRQATVMGMRGTRIYLAVEGFALDLKIYAADLERRWNCKYTVTDTRATPDDEAAPALAIGDSVQLRTARWDDRRSRFILDILPTRL
ncbi:MAG: ribonuclease catalytic domain-containing protein [Granulosicoccaceae bacterium]